MSCSRATHTGFAIAVNLLLAAVLAPRPAIAGTFGPYTDAASGHQYYVVEGVFTWAEADASAQSLNGRLASITSAVEQAWIQANVPLPQDWVWLGATEDANTTDDVFVWSSGEPFQYRNFLPGEPDDNAGLGGQGDALILERFGYQWLDMPPSLPLAGALVEVVPTTAVPRGHGGRASLRVLSAARASTVELMLTTPEAGSARVEVVDLAGRRVARLLQSDLAPGATRVTWDTRGSDGRHASAGLYFTLVTWRGETLVAKLVVAR